MTKLKKLNNYRQLTRLDRWVSSGINRSGIVYARDKFGKWHDIPVDYFRAEFVKINIEDVESTGCQSPCTYSKTGTELDDGG